MHCVDGPEYIDEVIGMRAIMEVEGSNHVD